MPDVIKTILWLVAILAVIIALQTFTSANDAEFDAEEHAQTTTLTPEQEAILLNLHNPIK